MKSGIFTYTLSSQYEKGKEIVCWDGEKKCIHRMYAQNFDNKPVIFTRETKEIHDG